MKWNLLLCRKLIETVLGSLRFVEGVEPPMAFQQILLMDESSLLMVIVLVLEVFWVNGVERRDDFRTDGSFHMEGKAYWT